MTGGSLPRQSTRPLDPDAPVCGCGEEADMFTESVWTCDACDERALRAAGETP